MFKTRVYQVTSKIPRGKVLTYGMVAGMSGNPRAARAVGRILHANIDTKNIPCHRVVGYNGRILSGYRFGGNKGQKRLLLGEGVEFVEEYKVDMCKCLWDTDGMVVSGQ